MHFSNDDVLKQTTTPAGRPARPEAEPNLKDTAGWQALYRAMLTHITGNVETWLQGYLSQAMASGAAAEILGRGEASDGRALVPVVPANGEVRFAIPPWLEPFKDPGNVRFTRTPDHILIQEKELWAHVGATNDDTAEPAPVAQAPAEPPPERKPYVLPPNVRNTRTPDRLFARIEPAPVPATPNDAGAAGAATMAAVVSPVTSTPPGGLSMAHLIADAYRTAVEADGPTEAQSDDTDAGIAGAAEECLPAPLAERGWTRVIRQDAAMPPCTAPEQDNAREALTRFLLGGMPEGQGALLAGNGAPVAVEPPVEVDEGASFETLLGEGDGVIFDETAWLDAFEIADMAETPEATGSPEPVEAPGAAEAAEVADVIAAALAPENLAAPASRDLARAEALPANALHMSLLSGLNATRPPRRLRGGTYDHPSLDLLSEPVRQTGTTVTRDSLEQHARLLEGVLEDFGIRGEIINVRPGPVVTLYELEPAPGIKSSRVVGLADDIARSMSAVSARVAVVQGRNVIGIELPNAHRDTVYLRELLAQPDFDQSKHKLAIALGKTIGGEPVIVDLARMPHLLVAGTTGSGKSVAINTMILSLLYRLKPEECRLIMVDPKMLELSIYDGIPHLLTPVVTDPKKAVVALKWAVREMEDRYKKMSKVGVRNIDGFNARVSEAKAKGETIVRSVHTGFDRLTGQATYASEDMDLTVLPYIVVIVDEMADLMMVAGKDIEGAIQRLAQMARAAGIHLIMATQRPSVDVITGTIKANFPTRISFQVTSKIDSRTILGEQGAEQLLGQGDMLHMMGGGRISRVHGPFVSDHEVELVVAHLKAQGQPDYLDVTTEEGEAAPEASEEEGGEEGAVFDKGNFGADDGDLYDQAVKIVLRDKKCSTSYIQRRLSVGYNKAASLVEKMEKEGIVGPANHAGKREILIYSRDMRAINISMPDEDDDA